MLRIVLSLIVWSWTLAGEQLPYRLFTTADGLVRNTITRLRREPNGYLWICTVEGLSLFDGSRFTNYTTSDGLPERRVNDILPAGDGSYWLATSAGLSRFRPRRALSSKESQAPAFTAVGGDAGPRSLAVLLEDRDHVLWAGGRSGLFRVRPATAALEQIPLQPPGDHVLSIFQDEQARLWIGTTGGLFRFLPSSGVAVRVYSAKDVSAIVSDRAGGLWLGEWGLTHVKPGRDGMKAIEHLGRKDTPALDNRVFGLRETGRDDIWVAATGILRFRPGAKDSRDRLRRVEVPPGWDGFVSSVEADSSGNIWAGFGRMGLFAASDTGLTAYTESDGLATTKVSGMVTDRDRLLIVTIGPNGYCWNEFDGTRFNRIHPRVPASVQSMGWGSGGILSQGTDGAWWAASERGLLRYPAAPELRSLSGTLPERVFTSHDGLADNVVLQVFVDSRGDVWSGSLTGVSRRDHVDGRWRPLATADLAGQSRAVESIAEDHAGAVWLGLSDLGVARYRNGEFQRIVHDVPKGVSDLFVDSRGRVWIASIRGGLGRIDHPELTDPPT